MANPYAQAASIAEPFTRLGSALINGQGAFERGRVEQSKALADIASREAQANMYNEKAEAEKVRRQALSPEFGSKMAATFAGLTDNQAPEMEQFSRQGNWGVNPGHDLPAELDGPRMPEMPKQAPEWFNPQVKQKYDLAKLAHMANVAGTGNTSGDKLFETLLSQGRIDEALRNGGPDALHALQAAMSGKAYSSSPQGVLSQLTGKETVNPEWQKVQRSAAAENYAQAGNANASAALSRSKIGQPTVNPDGSVTAPTGKPVKLSATAEKELFEADDNAQSSQSAIGLLKQALELNDKAYSGYFAKSRATLASNVLPEGRAGDADATILLDNIMTTQALESLKATFGAAPTEGERKILMDIQASADKTPSQRKAIIEKALKAAERRAIAATNKASALRSGTYNSVAPQGSGDGWSIEEVK